MRHGKEIRMKEIVLQAENLCFAYEENGRYTLNDINFKIKRGSKVAFMGANGSGKSTLFLCLNGILRPASGKLYLNGQPFVYSKRGLLQIRKSVGIVFQDPDDQLFAASVAQEISFGILNLGVSREEAREEVEKIIKRLRMTEFREKPTHALSGGQKKQVSIADILVMHPQVLILDEPTAALDPKHVRMVNELVEELSQEGMTILMATHDIDYACEWADEIILMQEGKILKQAQPSEICRDGALLAKTNLEEPTAVRIYQKLCQKGVWDAEAEVPVSMKELEQKIDQLCDGKVDGNAKR